jgi:hypothetical protein
VVILTCNPSFGEAEAGGLQGWPGLYSKTLFSKGKKKYFQVSEFSQILFPKNFIFNHGWVLNLNQIFKCFGKIPWISSLPVLIKNN